MLKKIKKVLPTPATTLLRRVKHRVILDQAYLRDKKRFLNSYSKTNLHSNAQPQLEARMVFHAHSLEKGLSHKAIRLGFGLSALTNLSEVMKIYLEKGFDKKSEAYLNSISVLKAYFEVHELHDFDSSRIVSLFSSEILDDIKMDSSGLGGTLKVSRLDKENNHEKDFKRLFLGRWSVREYDSRKVEPELIEEAISISQKSPSVCNRQSARVVSIVDPEKIRETLDLQNGFRGYDYPPVLLMVTADSATAIGAHERNQPYIDGGLFSMSLLLSLEYLKLAACPLNAMLTVPVEDKVRKLLRIPDSESIIMFISVGHFSAESSVPKSFRYSSLHRKIGGTDKLTK